MEGGFNSLALSHTHYLSVSLSLLLIRSLSLSLSLSLFHIHERCVCLSLSLSHLLITVKSFLLATPSQDVFLLLPLIPLGREVGGILLVMLLYDLRDDPSISVKVYLWDSFDGRDGDSCQAEW